MNKQTKHKLAAVVSPLALGMLKLHTRVTGKQRARVVVLNEYNQVLLVKGFVGRGWSLPGGGIEKAETPAQAAVRELHEETGIRRNADDLTEVVVLEKPEVSVNYVAHIFSVQVLSSELPEMMHNTRELTELEWFGRDDLPEGTSELAHLGLARLS